MEDVAVAGFQLYQDGAFVNDAGTTVAGKRAEDNEVFAISGIHDQNLRRSLRSKVSACASVTTKNLWASEKRAV